MPEGDCSIDLNLSDNNGGGWLGALINFFSSLFGGGGSGPKIVPAGYRRIAHYPAMQFISDSPADIQQFTPDMKEKSHAIEIIAAGVSRQMGRLIFAQMEDDEDPEEEAVAEAEFFQSAFAGRPTFSPTGGVWLRYDGGEFFLPGGIEGKPSDNGKGLIFDLGDNMSVRIQGPKTEGKYKYPTGYF